MRGHLSGREGVQTQARGEGERVLPEYTHQDREDPTGQRRDGQDLVEDQLGPVQISGADRIAGLTNTM